MKCPKCDGVLKEIDSPEGVVLDFCGTCKGLWFDSGETSAYFEMGKDLPDLNKSLEEAKPTPHICPRCQGSLEEISFLQGQSLLLDRCKDCEGLWFDFGEVPALEKIASRIGTPQSKIMIATKILERLGYTVIGSKVR